MLQIIFAVLVALSLYVYLVLLWLYKLCIPKAYSEQLKQSSNAPRLIPPFHTVCHFAPKLTLIFPLPLSVYPFCTWSYMYILTPSANTWVHFHTFLIGSSTIDIEVKWSINKCINKGHVIYEVFAKIYEHNLIYFTCTCYMIINLILFSCYLFAITLPFASTKGRWTQPQLNSPYSFVF